MSDIEIRTAFEDFIRSKDFPCVGAKSALARGTLEIFVADAIDRATSDLDIHAAVAEFGASLEKDGPVVQSFAVIFREPSQLDEEAFEAALWNRLQSLHNIDVASGEPWNEQVDPDPASAHFSMSIAGEAFFIVGLHPNASRPARRFDHPVLVFNSHDQFERLRADGRYDRMKEIIRERDAELAGGINPMLEDFGGASEARQYSGRMADPDWTPPFAFKADAPRRAMPGAGGCPVAHGRAAHPRPAMKEINT